MVLFIFSSFIFNIEICHSMFPLSCDSICPTCDLVMYFFFIYYVFIGLLSWQELHSSVFSLVHCLDYFVLYLIYCLSVNCTWDLNFDSPSVDNMLQRVTLYTRIQPEQMRVC